MTRGLWWIVGIAIGLLVAWFGYATYVAWCSNWNYDGIDKNAEYWGQVLGSGFAFLANGLFFVSLRLQAKELQATRAEMKQTRKVAEQQEKQLAAQVASSERARRIDTFFKLHEMKKQAYENWRRKDAALPEVIDGPSRAKFFAVNDSDRKMRVEAIERAMQEQLAETHFSKVEREAFYFGVGEEPPTSTAGMPN